MYSIAANLRWFVVAIVVVSAPWAVVGYLAARASPSTLVVLPPAIAYGMFGVAVAFAGRRFAYKRSGRWTHGTRAQLSLGYTLIDSTLGTVAGVVLITTTRFARFLPPDEMWFLMAKGALIRLAAEFSLSFVLLTLLAYAMRPEFNRQVSEG